MQADRTPSAAKAPEKSPQGQLGAALLAMRGKSKAKLSTLHDRMLGR